MLDFNEVVWHVEKRGKHAENTRKTRKNMQKTRKITRKTADSENFFADVLRCGRRPRGRGALWTPISKRGRVALRTRIICPPSTRDTESSHTIPRSKPFCSLLISATHLAQRSSPEGTFARCRSFKNVTVGKLYSWSIPLGLVWKLALVECHVFTGLVWMVMTFCYHGVCGILIRGLVDWLEYRGLVSCLLL